MLATENLIVEHKRCPTASFDIDNRILTLPMWEKASGNVYDMLVAHEVGHALFTPTEWFGKVDFPKSYLNVTEDVRVEKLMKRRYQGLPKSFAKGYSELATDDFFGIENDDVSKYNLIDRINLHYKIGPFARIPFKSEEQEYVDRAAELETFDEAVDLAREIYAFTKQQKELQEQQEEIQVDSKSSQQDQSQDQSQQQQSSVGDSDEEDSDDLETPSYNDGDEDQPLGSNSSDSSGGVHNDPDEVKTQDKFDEKVETLNKGKQSNVKYFEIPSEVNLNQIVADWSEIHDWIDTCRVKNLEADKFSLKAYNNADKEYRKFKNESTKEVNYLIKEFEMRKSADAYSRSGVAKTGVLDTSKLHTYMFREDIFKKIAIVPDGKNHGLIFVLDWSGSMNSVLMNTLKQLLSLTNFCKKAQIPFEVYAFTNEWATVRRAIANNSNPPDNSLSYIYSTTYHYGIKEKEFFISQYFNMMNILSSRSNSRNYERQCLNIWREAYAQEHYSEYPCTPGLGLSGTPLNEAIVSLNYILPKFKKENSLQKVNVCILTDGEGCNSAVGKAYSDDPDGAVRKVTANRIDTDYCLRDKQTGHVYKQLENGQCCLTNNLIQQVRDRNAGVNVLGFRILSANLTSFIRQYGGWRDDFEKLMKDWRKDHSVVVKNPIAFSSLYVIANNVMNQDAELTFSAGASKATITKAFKSMTKTKQNNKKILISFVEHVA